MRVIFVLMLTVLAFGCGNNNKAVPADLTGYTLTDYPNRTGLQLAIRTDANGKILEEGDVLDGTRDGTWTTFHAKNGLPATVLQYRKGQKNGIYLKIKENGQVEEKAYFIDDEYDGERIVYKHSRVKEEMTFKKGKITGTLKKYYDNGKIQEEGQFVDGQRHGISKWYNQEEVVTMEYEYKNGEKVEK